MHIKVDEDLPRAVSVLLREAGYECSTVSEQGMGGFKDPNLWERVQQHRQFLVTADKGFGDIRKYPPGSHGGILLLRPSEDGVHPLIELVNQVLKTVSDLRTLSGLLAVASPQGLRIRRPGA
jgi:predicted nuclease of predicted toxin-antitoxin system